MAAIKVTSTTGVDMSDYDLPLPLSGTVKTHTPTKWHIDHAADEFSEYTGKAFTYDGTFALKDSSGTIAGFTVQFDKGEKLVVTGLSNPTGDLVNAADGEAFLTAALAGDDTITGGKGADTLLGFGGNDTIDGGLGDDKMDGGAGNDTYLVNSKDDTITDVSGIDTAKISTLDVTTAYVDVENYIFTGKGNWIFTGNNLGDRITGGAGADNLTGGTADDRLDGGKGIDTMTGGGGNDTYVIDNLAEIANITENGGTLGDTLESSVLFKLSDLGALANVIENYTYTGTGKFEITAGDDVVRVLTGGSGSDKLTSGGQADHLLGNAGNDFLDGQQQGDKMEGGIGNDTYVVDDLGDRVVEGAKSGTDTVQSDLKIDLLNGVQYTGQEIENATLTGNGSVNLVGNALNNALTGNSGNNDIEGGAGNDAMAGKAGDDTYHLDSKGDKVTEATAEGDHDKIVSSLVIKAPVANVEDYAFTGKDDWSFKGTKGDNIITGGDGNDTLDGGGGKDTLNGGLGNDNFLVDSADDELDGGDGVDTAKISTDVVSDSANFTDVENFTFTGKGNWIFLGNTGDNIITGGAGNDQLSGNDGDDRLDGGKGNDDLTGGSGNDTYVVDNLIELSNLSESGGDTGDTLESSVLFSEVDVDDAGLSGAIENFTFTGKGNWSFIADNKDNVLQGGSGNDTLEAGGGEDTAVFHGNMKDYKIVIGTESVTVTDMNAKDGKDGTDTLSDFEHLKFADGIFDLGTATLVGGDSSLTGSSVAAADINGDGFADIIVGAVNGEKYAGAAYVVLGGAAGLPDSVDLTSLSGTDGFELVGAPFSSSFAGWSVSSAGDVNGDGFTDIIVGATNTGTGGKAFVVFGNGGPFDPSTKFSDLDGTDGFSLSGPGTSERAGFAVAAGDLNGDGFTDLIVGAPGNNTAGATGTTYVLFGHDGAFTKDFDLGDLNGTNGITITGNTAVSPNRGDWLGVSVAAGDINGDGIDDLVVGGHYADGGAKDSGNAFVLFGKANGLSDINVSDLDGTNGFLLKGAKTYDETANSVSIAGDLNGDGFADIVVGAPFADAKGKDSGAVYVVFGHDGTFADITLSALNGTNGFKITGLGADDLAGTSVSLAGDFNGDGYADLLIGADHAGPIEQGSSYLIFGHEGGFGKSLDLSKLTLAQGFEINGFQNEDGTIGTDGQSGHAVAAGDINGDGLDDLLIGANESTLGNFYGGNVAVLYGNPVNNTGNENRIDGDDGNDTIAGLGGAEIINGKQGADDLNGGGGKDVILGGSGDDSITVTDSTFRHIDGGGGSDSLAFDFAGAIDFGNLDANAATSDRDKISSIETIDADNGKNNALTIHLADVLDIAPQNQDAHSTATLDNVLTIEGDGTGDTLTLDGADGWTKDTVTLAGIYDLYTSGGVTLAVDTDIVVTVTPP